MRTPRPGGTPRYPLYIPSLQLLLLQIGVVLATAHLLGIVFHRISQPRVIGEMTAGILLGPSLLGRLAPGVFLGVRLLWAAAINLIDGAAGLQRNTRKP